MDAVFGSELDGRLSDKDALLGHAMAAVKTEGKAAMLGDRMYDMNGARATHGMLAIGALWGFGSPEELRDAGADHLAPTPQDVAAIITGAACN